MYNLKSFSDSQMIQYNFLLVQCDEQQQNSVLLQCSHHIRKKTKHKTKTRRTHHLYLDRLSTIMPSLLNCLLRSAIPSSSTGSSVVTQQPNDQNDDKRSHYCPHCHYTRMHKYVGVVKNDDDNGNSHDIT